MLAVTTLVPEASSVTKKKEPKATLYVEIPPKLKEEIDALAALHKRKITAEVIIALEEYITREKAKAAKKDGE